MAVTRSQKTTDILHLFLTRFLRDFIFYNISAINKTDKNKKNWRKKNGGISRHLLSPVEDKYKHWQKNGIIGEGFAMAENKQTRNRRPFFWRAWWGRHVRSGGPASRLPSSGFSKKPVLPCAAVLFIVWRENLPCCWDFHLPVVMAMTFVSAYSVSGQPLTGGRVLCSVSVRAWSIRASINLLLDYYYILLLILVL